MSRKFLAIAALAACVPAAARAQVDPNLAPVSDIDAMIQQCGYAGGCDCCAPSYAVKFDVDFLFLKYRQSGGVQRTDAGNIVGGGDNASFGYDLSPRFTLGVENANGLGARVRYWFTDQSAATDDGIGSVAIDAYTFDAEIYKRVQLGCSTTLEGFGGIRWSEFNYADDIGVDWRSEGVGLSTGFELSQHLSCNHRLYARTRLSAVTGDVLLTDSGDLDDTEGLGNDNISLQVELAAGYEGRTNLGRGVTLTYGAGAELQSWSDAAIKADASDEAYLSDAGWAGFSFRLGAEY